MRRINRVKHVIQHRETTSLEEATEQFITRCEVRGLSKHTVAYYQKELKQLHKALIHIGISCDNIEDITTQDLELVVQHWLASNRKPKTINSRIVAGKTLFKMFNNNSFDSIGKLKERMIVGRTFSHSELEKLLNSADLTTFSGLRDYTMMLTLAHTGIRLNELCLLSVQNVSFEQNALLVSFTKNRKERTIPLTKRLNSTLRTYIKERGTLDTDALFITLENNPISNRTVQERLQHYGKKEGISQVSPHAFRRTFARRKVEAGVNIFFIQRLMGHADLEQLQQYVEIFGKDLHDVIEKGT